MATGQLHAIRAKALILATGGMGRVYEPSSNGLICTGDGMALAYRAGAPLMDVELASRDVVSRAGQTEIDEGRGVNGFVLLDLRHLGRQKLLERLPQICELALDIAGVDPIEEPIPVHPGMHYFMGGVKTDVHGATAIPGLYAAGECACVSVHGANRLGGNSLLETVVFGRRTGRAAAEYATAVAPKNVPENIVTVDEQRLKGIMERPQNGDSGARIRLEMGKTMSQNVGIFRTGEPLEEAVATIGELKNRYGRVPVQDKGYVFNMALIFHLELGNMLDLAQAIATCALNRTESRCAHTRPDYPH